MSPGESLAIVGRSGCGKSTLLSVISSLRESSSGYIFIDGIPLQRIGSERYRSLISFVMQDDFLFSGTLLQNITSFANNPDIEHMKSCARAAAIHDEIEAMPLGYSTLIGELGSSLSGGQRQRISLSRALYRKPAILILDEATSALDIENERKINEAIKSMNITRIFAAHRPDAIAVADKIYHMTKK
ncbi:ATP-binding component of putative ABC transport protein [Candidatus Regiella insecticola LSR1]|uniref:ATP-binding component of putative ABC transport protein n=1 Tax=Candidatus Regiella insecticola LSR1 TaxID=663321 RepID=E0WU23_9ENTR|nr:ATP-binding component of putative ABC transport protein [Candidatus Regiella insecticola LSR1]